MTHLPQANPRTTGGPASPAAVDAVTDADNGGDAIPAGAAGGSRVALVRALICQRRRVALRHRRCPTDESRTTLAAIDEALAQYNINIPAIEQSRRSA